MRTRKIPNTDFLRSDRCGGYSKTWLKSVAFNRGFTVHDCKKNKITSYCYRKVGLNCIICKIKQQLSKVNKAQFKLLGYVEYVSFPLFIRGNWELVKSIVRENLEEAIFVYILQ